MLDVAIIGAGPAGLFAAERLSANGLGVCIFERMPSPARKFLLAGRGGLNLTHSEPMDRFVARYGGSSSELQPLLAHFHPDNLRDWAAGLGQETFVGSSGRVFPKSFKASPLLRAWLRRLEQQGVTLKARHHWQGWSPSGALRFQTGQQGIQQETLDLKPQATLLALGGASWPRLGADGQWVKTLAQHSIDIAPLQPANGGFVVEWSDYLRHRFAGTPLKRIALSFQGQSVRGEAMLTREGIEGGAIYALSAPLRNALAATGSITIHLDLRPDLSLAALAERLSSSRGSNSLANALRKQIALPPVGMALLRETTSDLASLPPEDLARRIKSMPIVLAGMNSIDRAISSAGGIRWQECDADLMLKAMPGVFCAGEMLDWEAPTGGYLLQGCFATAAAAAHGILRYLKNRPEQHN